MSDENAPGGVSKRDFFALLEKVGAIGPYQYLLTYVMSTANYLCGGITCIIPFLYYQDPYDCSISIETSGNCYQHACALPLQQRTDFIPSPSMSTLGNTFGDFRCFNEKFTLNMYITFMLSGRIIGSLILILFAQQIGRKKFFDFCLIVGLLGVIGAVISNGLLLCSLFLMFSVSTYNNVYYISFSLISEKVAESHRQKFCVLMQIFFSIGILCNPLWFYLFKDWKLALLIGYGVPTLIATVISICFIKDSPMNIVTRQQSQKSFKDFLSIAKINGVEEPQLSEKEIGALQRRYSQKLKAEGKSKVFSFIDLLRYDSLRHLTLKVTYLVTAFFILFYGPAVLIDRFSLGLYANGVMVGAAQVVSYSLCYLFVLTYPRRLLYKWGLSMSTACALVLYFLWDQQPGATTSDALGLVILVVNFAFRVTMTVPYSTFYVHYNQVFPTQVRAIAGNLVSFACSVALMVIPLLVDTCIEKGVPVMLTLAVINFSCLIVARMLPETFGVTPRQIIEQLDSHGSEEERDKRSLLEMQFIHPSESSIEMVIQEQTDKKLIRNNKLLKHDPSNIQ